MVFCNYSRRRGTAALPYGYSENGYSESGIIRWAYNPIFPAEYPIIGSKVRRIMVNSRYGKEGNRSQGPPLP